MGEHFSKSKRVALMLLLSCGGCFQYRVPDVPDGKLAFVHTQVARIKSIDGHQLKGYEENYSGVFWGPDETHVSEGKHHLAVEWCPQQATDNNNTYQTTEFDFIFKAGHTYLVGSDIARHMISTVDDNLYIHDETDQTGQMLGGPGMPDRS